MKLLVRDLAQLATPAGREAPLRGAALGEVDVLEDAYVLCEDDSIAAVGRMRDLPAIDEDVVEVDGRGLCAIPGLVDCHTHAAFGGDRVEEFSLRAGGASYEELHARGRRHPLDRPRDPRRRGGWPSRGGRASSWLDARARHDDVRVEVRVRARSRHRARLAPRGATARAGWRRGSARTPFRPSSAETPMHISTSPSQRSCPEAAKLAEAADVFLERGAFDAAQARRYLEASRAAGLALRLHGDQFTEQGAIPLAVELHARSVDHLEATGAEGVQTLAASDVVGVLLPASALFLGRPMPPGRALVDAGAAVALATDFNPGSAFCESLPLCCSLAATQLKLSPAECLAACTVNAAHVLGRSDRLGRLAPGYRADIVLLDAPDWRYLAYHLGGDLVARTVVAGELG